MTNHKIDEDVVTSLKLVRLAMAGAYRLPQEVRQALTVLDNADVFREVDEVAAELEDQRLLRKYDSN